MAILIPDFPQNCTGSERLVYHRLERDLSEDWVVLHSLGLANHETKLWGEADFVILSTKGIFVLEVKGGDVTCQNGSWHYGRPDSKEFYTKKEGPFKQAKDAMFALKNLLAPYAELRRLLVGYGVVMPHAVFVTEGPEIEQEVLLDGRAFGRPLGFFIGRLQRFWSDAYAKRHGDEKSLPTTDEIRRIRQILRPDVGTTLSLGSFMNGLEQDLIQLTHRQIRAVRGMDNNSRTVITGRAGTGKSVLAIDRARRLAAQGKKVLFVCYNKALAQHVEYSLHDEPDIRHIRVRHLHGLMRDSIAKAEMTEALERIDVPEVEWFGTVFPEIFIEAALTCEPEMADVLVVDEAQDLLTPSNLDALDLLVQGGIRKGLWNLFLDPLQNIYGKSSEEAMNLLSDAGFASYELYENCRNTQQVAVQTSIISGVEMALDGAVQGLPCDCVYYANREDLIDRIHHEVRRLIQSDVAPRDIVILSTRRYENSSISGIEELAGLKVCKLSDVENQRDDAIHFSTIHAFKGLERRVVIAIDLDGLGNEHVSLLHYAGLSRAIGLLVPFLADSERKNYRSQAERFGARLAAK